MKKFQHLYFGETYRRLHMKSWIRRFALLAVMGSLVGGIVMAGCSSSGTDDNAATPDANAPAPPADQAAPPAPGAPAAPAPAAPAAP
jgi:hypothetical protein